MRQVPPYIDFSPGAVGGLVRVHLQKSGIHLEGKKKGSHTLRHSLASRLLEHEIPLPVISEILGHTTTETTMTYLRIEKEISRLFSLFILIVITYFSLSKFQL